MSSVFFYILIRSRKAFSNFDKCINSVFDQNYKYYKIIFVDDFSPLTKAQKNYIKDKLRKHIVVFNNTQNYSLKNAYDLIRKYAKKVNSVIFVLDGDDWLLPHALSTVAKSYKNKLCKLTYGECLVWNGSNLSLKPSRQLINYTNTPYPNRTFANKSFRKEPFRPLHARTFKASIFNSLSKEVFLDSQGNWFTVEDLAIFFPILEILQQNEVAVIKKPIYAFYKQSISISY